MIPKKKWTRVARQLGHSEENALTTHKIIAKALGAGSLKSNLKKNRCTPKVSDYSLSISYTELAVVALQPHQEL